MLQASVDETVVSTCFFSPIQIQCAADRFFVDEASRGKDPDSLGN